LPDGLSALPDGNILYRKNSNKKAGLPHLPERKGAAVLFYFTQLQNSDAVMIVKIIFAGIIVVKTAET
jgi:hypothetical protein